MKIIYITTSLEENDYIEFNKMWLVSLNPSNQNFHNKMIRALAINNKIEVISVRPFSRKNCLLKRLKAEEKEKGNIIYHYLRVPKSKIFRYSGLKKQAKKIINKVKDEETLVISDTINPRCMYLASYIKTAFGLPSLGLCTDSPSNITGTSRSYTMYLLRQCQKLDGYITLTEGLNMLFNQENKKYMTIPGIVESHPEESEIQVDGKYLFFGGALLPRYGVFNLIEAFKKIEDDKLSLLVCGHHGDNEKINHAIGEDSRIKYLGTLPVKEVLALESNALMNINPRPFTQDLDRLSVPSKTLEYLASGRLTISVRNTELEKVFKKNAIWAKTGNVEDLYNAIKTGLEMSDEKRQEMAESAKNIAISRYSIEKVGDIITDFLQGFLS